MLLSLLGLLLVMLALWVIWLLTDGMCALIARLRIEARQQRANKPLRLIVQERLDITNGLFRLVLARADRKRLPAFQPGQYLTVCVPAGAEGRQVSRRYSLAAWEAKPHEYRLGIKRADKGQVSVWLHAHARPDTVIEVLPPAGDFVLRRRDCEVVLVAGGIGLTPMAAMVDALMQRRSQNQRVWLFHAARQLEELVDFDHYVAMARSLPNFHYRPYLSKPPADWSGGLGRLDAQTLMRELAAPAEAEYYLCARQDMMEALAQGLTTAGISPAAVHWESFGGAVENPDRAEYQVSIAGHGCRTFQNHPSLLNALESWGLPVKAECRTGTCGACLIDIHSGQVRQRQTPVVDVPPGSVLACCVVPKTDIEIVL